jgi:hypothetical protein
VAKYTLRAAAARASSPAIVLTDLDAALHRWFAESGVPGMVTVSYLSLRRSGAGYAVRICTAGHPPATIRRADGTLHRLGRLSSALGILPRLSLTIDEAELGPGDTLVLTGHGVTASPALPSREPSAASVPLRATVVPASSSSAVVAVPAGSVREVVDGLLRDGAVVLALRVPVSAPTAPGPP